jgi:hypothetical protein
MNGSFVNALFHDEPAGTFVDGYIFLTAPDLADPEKDHPDAGYWHCDIANQNRLTWSEKVYELFGLPAGTPVDRDWAVAHYSNHSKSALERVRRYALSRDFGFIIDVEIEPEGSGSRWIRVLATQIVKDGRVVGLHGLKRALSPPIR